MIIAICTFFIIKKTIKFISNNTKNIKEIEVEELEKLNINPNMETVTEEEIDSLFEKPNIEN